METRIVICLLEVKEFLVIVSQSGLSSGTLFDSVETTSEHCRGTAGQGHSLRTGVRAWGQRLVVCDSHCDVRGGGVETGCLQWELLACRRGRAVLPLCVGAPLSVKKAGT